MKIKFLPLVAILAVVVLFSCEKNTQKAAQADAQHEQTQADNQAQKAEDYAEKAMDHAEKAAGHQSRADMNDAMAKVTPPTFDNIEATNYANMIGNDVREFVDSEDYSNAGKYADKIQKDLNKLAEKVANGSIQQSEADEILSYGQKLAESVGIQVSVSTSN